MSNNEQHQSSDSRSDNDETQRPHDTLHSDLTHSEPSDESTSNVRSNEVETMDMDNSSANDPPNTENLRSDYDHGEPSDVHQISGRVDNETTSMATNNQPETRELSSEGIQTTSNDLSGNEQRNNEPVSMDTTTGLDQHTNTDSSNYEPVPHPDISVSESPSEPTPQLPSGPNSENVDPSRHPACQFHTDRKWLDPQYHDNLIKKPHELDASIDEPPSDSIDPKILDRIQGSIIGMALGDALGAHVEFRPRQYLVDKPVTDLEAGGTWGLNKGQFTDDTSMALCLANSLIARRDFVPYDQLVRYKWWYKQGYMSSTGHCFDIGAATRQSIAEFQRRQQTFAKQHGIPLEQMDNLSDENYLKKFDVYCSDDEVAGNGALMRLAPVPLFFYRDPAIAVKYSGQSGQITHGDRKAYDACRYYGALIVAALQGESKGQLLDKEFYSKHRDWFGNETLHPDIQSIADGSYQKGGYDAGIRGKGYIVKALEAALWAFWSDKGSFEKGSLAAVNLGDDTDTTAAIYGQLAGACYGYRALPAHWLEHVYAKTFMEKLSKWIAYEGECWYKQHHAQPVNQ